MGCTTWEESTEKGTTSTKTNNTARRRPFLCQNRGVKSKINKVQIMPHLTNEHDKGKTQMVQLVKVICATRWLTFATTNQKTSGKTVVSNLWKTQWRKVSQKQSAWIMNICLFSRRQSEDGLESDISAAACPQQGSSEVTLIQGGGNEIKFDFLV